MTNKILEKRLSKFVLDREQWFCDLPFDSFKHKLLYGNKNFPYKLQYMDRDKVDLRLDKSLQIYYHFSLGGIEEIDSNNEFSKYFPEYFTNFSWDTFDAVDFYQICDRFGYCIFCKHFSGFNKTHPAIFHGELEDKKVSSITGKCKNVKMEKKEKETPLTFVLSNYRCGNWLPNKLINYVIHFRVVKRLKKHYKNRMYKVARAYNSNFKVNPDYIFSNLIEVEWME